MKEYTKIIPLVKKCTMCKKANVKNHHFLCDACYSKKAKREIAKIRSKLVMQQSKAKLKKKPYKNRGEQ
jgi:hypothetical protein